MEDSNERNSKGYWENRLKITTGQTLLTVYDGLSLALTSISVYINSLEDGPEKDSHLAGLEDVLGVKGDEVLEFFEEIGVEPVNLDSNGNEYVDNYDDEFDEEDEIFKYDGLYEFNHFLNFYLGYEYEGKFYSEPNKEIEKY